MFGIIYIITNSIEFNVDKATIKHIIEINMEYFEKLFISIVKR